MIGLCAEFKNLYVEKRDQPGPRKSPFQKRQTLLLDS